MNVRAAMSKHATYLGVLVALASTWLAGCDRRSPTNPSSTLTSVQITNAEGLQRLPLGWTTTLGAKAQFTDGTTKDVTTDATWSSSDPSVITVAAVVTVIHGAGRATITAAYQGVTTSTVVFLTPLTSPDMELWELTTTVASVTGESTGCTAPAMPVGSAVSWILGIKRNGSSITFDYDVRNMPTDDTYFTGTLMGRDFVADSTGWTLTIRCSTGKVFDWRSTHLAGQFGTDGRSLSAREVWTWVNAESGDAITTTYNWVATVH
jgi:hypothetical protein